MSPPIQGALARAVARVVGSRFAKPIARVVLVAAGLVLLAVIGRASAAGTFGRSTVATFLAVDASVDPGLTATNASPPASLALTGVPAATATPAPPVLARGRATADDPVILNAAATEDLRRLPGIGQKRADAIMALRMRLGRFRAIEDLMKVKGIGRAMLRRLRPLVRLDLALPPSDAGVPAIPR